MANKIVLKSISLATYSNSWQLLATKRVAGFRNFVLGKQDGPTGWLPWFVQTSRTTHSDYSLPPIGII